MMIKNLLVLAALFMLCACDNTKSIVQEEIGNGSMVNGLYTNKYFNMSIKLPLDWALQSAAQQEELMAKGSEIIAGDDKNLKAQVELAKKKTLQLFTMFRHPQGSAVKFNYSFISAAERVKDLPGIKRGSDYHFHVKQALAGSQLDYKFPQKIFSETISGVSFDIMPTELHLNGQVVHQHYYACRIKDYVLMIILSFSSEEEKAELSEILKTLKMN